MTTLKGKRILIFQQRGWGVNIGHFLTEDLQNEGCRLAALTLKKTTDRFIKNQKQVNYEYIWNHDQVMEEPEKYLGSDEITIREICDELGIDTVWLWVQSLRNHVKSYKQKYYYGFQQNISDNGIVAYVKAAYKLAREIFDKFSPELIVSPNFVAFPHILLSFYARKNGVAMMGVTDTKIRGYYMFTHSYLDDSGPVFNRFKALESGECKSNNIIKAKKYIERFEDEFIEPANVEKNRNKKRLIQRIRNEAAPYYRILRYYLKAGCVNRIKTTGITLDYLPPKIIFRDHFAHKRNLFHANHYQYYEFSDVGEFIYFPLQFQPEATIDVIAPRQNNQIETARQVAMSLPDDYTLVVKDHPSMAGLRSKSYLDKIANIPNIKLIDYRIHTEEVLSKTSLVISPNSTTLAEAAFMKIPAIQLGPLGTTKLLPNITYHPDLNTLPKAIRSALKKDCNTAAYAKTLTNYVAAVMDAGFCLDYGGMWEKGNTGERNMLWKIYRDHIVEVLNHGQAQKKPCGRVA
ncbi:MAG: hypothetical protein KAR13_07120 [Desulfobulbaceae bacterium]|nr:hypothetical protein [Desulfobulbaceae bacterium]